MIEKNNEIEVFFGSGSVIHETDPIKFIRNTVMNTRGVNAIVYMVDAADSDKIEASRNELHNLLEKPQEYNHQSSSVQFSKQRPNPVESVSMMRIWVAIKLKFGKLR